MSENYIQYTKKKDSKNAAASASGRKNVYEYKPKKKDAPLRRRIWDRYNDMKSDPLRIESLKQADLGDKMYRMWAPERDARDWRADIRLPDGFSAVQSHLQEVITLRPRPLIKGQDKADSPLETFIGDVFNGALDKTEFDEETFKARQASAIRGNAYTREEYRYETREVRMPSAFKEGKIEYKKKTIVDYDDVYTRHIENEAVFTDPGAEAPKYMNDWVYREVIDFDVYKATYLDKPGFIDTEKVVACGEVPPNAGFFKPASDVNADQVEILHYENKLDDTYGVLANNVLIRNDPLPSTHKQLSLDVWSFYPIPGQIYGLGIPYIIHTLVEERRSIRNMSLDRQKMQIAKMFLVNDLFDIAEEDLTPRPHGLIRVNTNGLPLNQAVMPLEYGDVPGSSLRMDESLKEDERRAHGMDDRPALPQGGTATEAAIVKESAQQRINLVSTLSNWNTLVGLGRKKLSNILFYYPTKRMESIYTSGEQEDKELYRNIRVEGREYEVAGDPENGQPLELVTKKIPGWSSFRLDPTFSQFMMRSWDVIMDAEAIPIVSQAIKRATVNEMFMTLSTNPVFARFLDLESSINRYITVNGESPKNWVLGDGDSPDAQRAQAQLENEVFMNMETSGQIFMLPGTPNATEAHNEVHLDFTQTEAYARLSEPVKAVIQQHINEEIQANPALAAAAGMAPGGAGGGEDVPPGMPGGPLPDDGSGAMQQMIAGGDVTQGNAPQLM